MAVLVVIKLICYIHCINGFIHCQYILAIYILYIANDVQCIKCKICKKFRNINGFV